MKLSEGSNMARSSNTTGVYNPHREEKSTQSKRLIALAVLLVIVGLFAIPSYTQARAHRHSAMDFTVEGGPYEENIWDVLLISDLDKKSKIGDDGKSFRSVLQEGKLTRDPSTNSYSVTFGDSTDLVSGHNEAGRGMELSELVTYRGDLMAVDDRTGIVFHIVEGGADTHMAPRYIISEGDGEVDKGMKLEWATVKDGSLIVGSFGKEYTKDGAVVSTNNNWVNFIDAEGRITRQDWTEQYNALRESVGAGYPGYMIHEAAGWSDVLQKWVFMPRRISSEAYDDMKDEKMGSDTILIADEDFRNVEVRHAGTLKPTHGFSSFKFVPGTNDDVVVALKSVESEELDTQDTFLTVFTLEGEVLLDEEKVPGALKFEGVEIRRVEASARARHFLRR